MPSIVFLNNLKYIMCVLSRKSWQDMVLKITTMYVFFSFNLLVIFLELNVFLFLIVLK